MWKQQTAFHLSWWLPSIHINPTQVDPGCSPPCCRLFRTFFNSEMLKCAAGIKNSWLKAPKKKKKTLVPKVPIIQHSQVFCQGLSACFKKKINKKAPVFQIETVLPQGTVASVIPAGPSRSPPHFLTPHKPPPAPGGAEPDGVQLFHRSTCDSLHGANLTCKCTASFQATIMRTSTIGCNSCFSNCIFNLKFPRTWTAVCPSG